MKYPWEFLTSHLDLFWKLPFQFDAEKLLEEYKEVDLRYKAHNRLKPHEISNPGWNHIGLKCAFGDPSKVLPTHHYGTKISKWTDASRYTPYTKSCIESLGAEVRLVRYAKLAPHFAMRVHREPHVSTGTLVIRIHVPVIAHENSRQRISHQTSPFMKAGEAWSGEFTFPHHAWNENDKERVHLMFEVKNELVKPEWISEEIKNQKEDRELVLKQVAEAYLPYKDGLLIY